MPTLRQLRCVIEWGNTETPFPEYGTTYGDGVVETYIAIPDHPQPFAIHLTSRNYIAEGLSMLVFMDGDYHCNRNRLNLQRPEPGIPRNLTEIGLRVRQKENPLGEGRYLGRGWRFDKHKIVPLNQLPSTVHRQHFNDLGTICVFVLRCRAKEEVDFKSSTSSEVDDSALQTPEPTDPTPSEDHAPSTTAEPQGDGGEPDTLLGFLNDGATDVCHFGLDGEGPGPAEQKAWSWNTQRPSPSARQGPSGGYTPGQPPPAQNQPYGNYGHPPGFARSGQPGPAFSQSQPTTHRPQRHVHFNDQLPPQPSGYGAPSQQASGQDASGNAGQPQEREYPQQANNVGHPPPSQFAHQVPNYAPVHDGYVNPWLPHAGIPNAQDHSRGFPAGTDWSYPAPMPNTQDFSRGFAAGGDWAYPPPVQHTQDHSRTVPAGENVSYLPPMPSYQPVGYGVSSYPGWTLAPITPAYTQPAWPAQPMPAYGVPGFPTPPAFVPPSLPSRAHPNPQPTWQSSPAASTPAPASSHPGGGVWGPPPTNPGSQDPAKDENNQLDGQTYQNQDNTSNIGGQSNDNNNQDLANAANDGTQAGSSGWNNNEASGGQMNDWNNNGEGQTDNWNNTAGETEAPSHDWNQSTANAGQTDNTGSPWNANASTNTQVQDSWDANANASTQVQNSWNAAAATAQPAEATFRFPQQDSPAAMPAQGRSLHGPHGPYYHTLHTSAGQRIQADAGEEPPYDVPADMPTTHQVKPGEGYLYVHKRRSPEYLDTLEEPYARFVFKYRTKEQIENETGIKIEDKPTGDEEKRKLQEMQKDELVEMLLRAKIALGGKVPSPPQLPLQPDGCGGSRVKPIAIPAPEYNFLGYDVPAATRASNIPPQGNNVGLGVSIPAPAYTATQDWAGNNDWGSNSAPQVQPALQPQQQPTAGTWDNPPPPPPTPQQRPITNAWAAPTTAPPPPQQPQQQQQQPTAGTWDNPPPPPTNTWAAPASTAAPSPQQQQQQQQQQSANPWPAPPPSSTHSQLQPQQPQPPPQPQPIPPVQFSSNVQTYKPIRQPKSHPPASDRPITPPGGYRGGGGGAQTVQSSSNASDNGMAAWDVGGGGGDGGGGGWGGGAGQPEGFW